MMWSWILLVYLHGAHATPTAMGYFDNRYECMLEKYKQPQHKAVCLGPDDQPFPPYRDAPYNGEDK